MRDALARFALELQEAREMLIPQFEGSGLGIMIAGAGEAARFQHGGGNAGFRCQLEATLETGQGTLVMTNSDTGGPPARELLRSIAQEYGWPAIKPEQ